jgi:surfactin synthase thioesterase subunit
MVDLSDLVRSLPGRPVVGLTAPGVDEGTPLAVVEELAGLFRRELLEQGYRPPYTIVGCCIGGAVALELAHQLGSDQVEIVALVDSWLPTTTEPTPWDDLIQMFNLGRIMTLNIMRDQPSASDVNWRLLARYAKRILPVFRAMIEGWRSYEPRRYDGRVVLFHYGRHHALSESELRKLFERNHALWEAALGQPIELVMLPGCGGLDHGLEAANVELVAAKLGAGVSVPQ